MTYCTISYDSPIQERSMKNGTRAAQVTCTVDDGRGPYRREIEYDILGDVRAASALASFPLC